MKLNRFYIAAFSLLALYALSFAMPKAQASSEDLPDIFQNIELKGLSMMSSAQEINAFLEKTPDLQCRFTDTPARTSKIPNRPTQPRQRNWNCSYSHPTLSSTLTIKMIKDDIVYLHFDTRYTEEEDLDKVTAYIHKTYNDLKEAGLKEHGSHNKNYIEYSAGDSEGASSPVYSQFLRSKFTTTCGGEPDTYALLFSSSKMKPQNIFGAGLKIERQNSYLHCTE